MNKNETYRLIRNQDALEYCKKQSMLEQMVGDEKWRHYEYAAKALEKQLPQKVINKGYFYGYACHCPVCNKMISSFYATTHAKYCSKCGQVLDWSE